MKYRSDQPLDLQLHDGELFFLIRGQDVLAIPAVTQYAVLARQIGQHDLAQQVSAVAVEIARWQKDNPEKIGLPD